MRLDLKNNGYRNNRLVGHLVAEKKKMIIAFCLIGLMAFMWVRVLGKKGPQGVEAAFIGEQISSLPTNSQLKISFIKLPHIKGRHDVLTRDFFTVENWRDFIDTQSKGSSGKEVDVVAKNGFGEVSKLVEEKLKLEVIELGSVPQAFIGGKLLKTGDIFEVSDGVNDYQCEVLRIEKNSVYLRCGSTEVQLKLIQLTEETAGQ